MEGKLSPRRQLYDKGLRALLWICAGLTCALLVFLIGYIFYRGLGNISWQLLTSQTSYIKDTIGILPNIFNTLYIILVAMVIVLPLGVGAAIYLTEYAGAAGWWRSLNLPPKPSPASPPLFSAWWECCFLSRPWAWRRVFWPEG